MISSNVSNSRSDLYENKHVILKKCHNSVVNITLESYLYVIKFLATHSPKCCSKHLKPHWAKVIYRILHNDAKMQELETAKVFQKYLVQPMRNIPSLEVLNRRDVSGAEDIFCEIRDGCYEAMLKASAKKTLKVAQLYYDIKIAKGIIKIAIQEGIKLDSKLSVEENAIKIIKSSQNIKKIIVTLTIAEIFPDDIIFDDTLEGVCGAVGPYFASQYFQGKTWKDMTKDFSKGVNTTVRNAFSVYVALKECPAYNLMSSYFDVHCKKVKAIHLNSGEEQKKAVKKILKLEDGVYDIGLAWLNQSTGHTLVLHKEGNTINIIDPNVGLLTAKDEKAKKLLKKLIAIYYNDANNIGGIGIAKYEDMSNKNPFKNALFQRF